MENKKLYLTILVVFAVITIFDLVFNEAILGKYYLEYSYLFKPQDEIQKSQPIIHIANLIYSFAFCYIYSMGHEKKKNFFYQGIRFGIVISLLIWLPLMLVNIVYYPYPKALEAGWFIGYSIQSILAGITASAVYSKQK